MITDRRTADQFRKDEASYWEGLEYLKSGNRIDGIHKLTVAARYESAIEQAAPILNRMFKNAF